MPGKLFEDEFGNPRNAHALATAADLAYLPESAAVPAFRERLGLEAKLVSAGNTQCYVATDGEHIVAAFRGTEAPTSIEGLKDWLLTDAVTLLIMPEGDLGTDFAAAGVGTRWHQGFIRGLNEIWAPTLTAVEAERKKSDRPLWITGHSLGGALALLAGWRFKRKFIPVHQIYTFGAPMVGCSKASAAIDREFGKKVYRYVNDLDPVPKLPTVSLLANEYGHCQKEVLLGVAAAAAGGAAGGSPFGEFAKRTAGGVLSGTLVDDFWKVIHDRIGAHAMALYLARVAELFKRP
jgi:triacylglycerol lipase